MKILIAILLVCIFQLPSYSQCDTSYKSWDAFPVLPSNTSLIQEKWALAQDAMDANNYSNAIAPLEWFLENKPCLNRATYIHLAKAYSQLERNATGKEKITIQDKLLNVYDLRLLHFGDSCKVLQLKGSQAYRFLMKREKPEQYYAKLYQLYELIFNSCGLDVKRSNLLYYADLTARLKRKKLISLGKHHQIYEQLTVRIDAILKTQEGESYKKWKKTQQQIQNKLATSFIDCEFVNNHWLSRLQTHRYDSSFLAKMRDYLQANYCADQPIYIEAATQHAEMGHSQVILDCATALLKLENKKPLALQLLKVCYANCQSESGRQQLKKQINSITTE